MTLRASTIFMVVYLASFVHAQAVTYNTKEKTETISENDLARRIFDGEQRTITQFAKRHPVMETYAQSLDPEVAPQTVIDDAYFLTRVSVDPEARRHQIRETFAFGRSVPSRQVKMNNGETWMLNPDGYVSMLFVDLTQFDRYKYALKYEHGETLGNTECLVMSVTPIDRRWPGQFEGRIWVETTDFRIVRIQGRFTPKRKNFFIKHFNVVGYSNLGIYFHFDSQRQEVSPGLWLPAYTYFDDQLLWNQARFVTSYRFRGHIWLWDYKAEDTDIGETQRPMAADPMSQLQANGLIASSGSVETWLDGLVQKIRIAGHMTGPDVHCRILVTTPVELFSIGNIIVVSRGLLNTVPDESILSALLAHEVAQISLGSEGTRSSKTIPVFSARRMAEFPGFGFKITPAGALAAREKTMDILAGSEYAASIPQADKFEAMLSSRSSQTPHLLRGGFGFSLVEKREASPSINSSVPITKTELFTLRGDYGINSWTNNITKSDVTPANEGVTESTTNQTLRAPSD
jgi:hypothetical protein